ncbi:MAG TPA: substrate-binding domain-containing protein, partial [Oceanipulchritudo sp.]|nr:substrate-binding domain-containing protein [Oceanipulchritudo sp.]
MREISAALFSGVAIGVFHPHPVKGMKRHFIGLMVLSGILSLTPMGGRSLTLAGSDLFGESVKDALKAELREGGIEAEIRFEGSLLGERELEEGQVEAALLALPDGTKGESPFQRYPVGFQLVVGAVHAANPVQVLTYTELAELFRSNGTINDWKGLTEDPDWSEQKLSLVAMRSEDSVALEIFNALVLKGQPLKRSVRILEDAEGGVARLLSEEAGALILTPWRPGVAGIKAIAVREGRENRGYTPTPDNVFFGDYPLRLP